NTLSYQAGMLGGAEVIDLPTHHAARIAGMVLNVQASDTFPVLSVSNPADQSGYLRMPGGPVTPVSVTSAGGFGAKTFSAVGLPPGVVIDPQTGVISGYN